MIKESDYHVCIVGAGLSGAVIAEHFARIENRKVLIIDKRNHVAGNCYDYINENGILVNEYGAHLFHTNDEEVWKYIQRFGEWERWEHQVIGYVDGKLINIPVNITTVNKLCNLNISNEDEMSDWLKNVQFKYKEITNSEQMAKSRVGEQLYEKIFKHYTFKQWNKYPEELDPSVLARVPIRDNFDCRYFVDKYQALPKGGYTKLVAKMLDHPNISIKLNTDYFDIKKHISFDKLIFTGKIDQYFKDRNLDELEYRSIEFIKEDYRNLNYYQINSVVNYPQKNVPYTRIVEYKHFLNQDSPHTTIVKEISKDNGEPYYPVPTERNISLYGRYKEFAEKEKDVYFLGRLANYKYFNMDQAIKNAIDFFHKIR